MRFVHKGRTISNEYFLDFEEKYGKYCTAGRLIILSVVTSLHELERQRHLQFALQFLFAVLHGQQPRPLFRAQVPLHGQETSSDPWSYLTRMANFD